MMDTGTTELPSLALTVLGIDLNDFAQPSRRADANTAEDNNEAFQPTQTSQPARSAERRLTSYFNTFQTKCTPSTDSPPSYAVSARLARIPSNPRYFDGGREVLPKYTCTVAREGVMQMRVEKVSPFQFLPKQEWRTVYTVLRGTQLSIHKVKTMRVGGLSVDGPGKLIRQYTLQHAEVGLATDVVYHILVPLTKFANLIPAVARRRAFEKDPDLFKPVRQNALRLRVETDQILLAERSEEQVFNWILKICAGIDIAPAIDDRAVPKQCTVPRRRRRQRPQVLDNLRDSRLVEEQEQILRDLYPAFAQNALETANTDDSPNEAPAHHVPALTLTTTQDQDFDDIDLAVLAEDMSSLQTTDTRPSTSRQTTASTVASTGTSLNPYWTNPANLDARGKWAPLHPHTPAQQWRYIRRCIPILLYDSPRASNILICHGARLRINTRMDMLEEWDLAPPTYDSHTFPSLHRSLTQSSSLSRGAASVALSGSSRSETAVPLPADGDITVARLGKSRSREALQKRRILGLGLGQTNAASQRKVDEPVSLDSELVVVGF